MKKCFAVIATFLLLGITILWNKEKLWKTAHRRIDKSREDLDNPYSALLLGSEVIYDVTTVASKVNSSVHLVKNRKYAVGERARVLITLRDQLGRRKTSGGDVLRVWLRDNSIKANVAGDVIDNGNGTYTGSVLLPWKGRPKLYVSIAIPREMNILILHSMVKNLGSVYTLSGMFNKTSHGPSELTQCGPQPMTQPTNMCNLTQQNYDLDWYCKAPTTHGITCQDWKMALGNGKTYVSKTDMEFITQVP
ncbi:NXPE family member 2-like [Mizuhopecten yessoensis]|uniref:NXPE family member 2-like n=1 Tax=Mizuhopecten yessoensis TaxID=6573 RepID=UPI000B45D523|nr:NXPE family member 2-like [Mizuhopecten yessoensis]